MFLGSLTGLVFGSGRSIAAKWRKGQDIQHGKENARQARISPRDPRHIPGELSLSCSDKRKGSNMYLIDGLIVLVMMFFFALPITDAKTVRMKLSVVSCLGLLLAVTVVVPRLMH